MSRKYTNKNRRQKAEYYRKNKKKIRKSQIDYYYKNRSKISERSKKYYAENSTAILKRNRKYRENNPDFKDVKARNKKIRYQRTMEEIANYKAARGCKNCYEYDPVVLDFHHREPSKKKYGIMYLISGEYSKDVIMSEISKCDILCANCHRRLHSKERKKKCS